MNRRSTNTKGVAILEALSQKQPRRERVYTGKLCSKIERIISVSGKCETKVTGGAEIPDPVAVVEPSEFYQILRKCPCYGTDDARAYALAADFTTRVYTVYNEKKPRSFIDSCILTEHQFLRYEREGLQVGPTPDGRKGQAPTCDSIAAIRGKAKKGPTAMLNSAAKLPQHLAQGISVLNLTLAKHAVTLALKPLIQSYFAMGGIQVQVTGTSVEELQDAMAHPERHRDLIVRVGGYSDYFCNLTPALRQAVLERNIHELN